MAKKNQKKTTQAPSVWSKSHNASALSHAPKGRTLGHSPCDTCTENCVCANCPQRILIVGGIERMEPLYREAIEAKGHIFEYHAGHLRKGGNKLENLLQRADVVLCPVNCNSHTACLQVKSLCKKHKKNLHIMKNFSLSAIERTLNDSVGIAVGV